MGCIDYIAFQLTKRSSNTQTAASTSHARLGAITDHSMLRTRMLKGEGGVQG